MGENIRVDADDTAIAKLSEALKSDPSVVRGLASDATATLAEHGITVDERTAKAIQSAVASGVKKGDDVAASIPHVVVTTAG